MNPKPNKDLEPDDSFSKKDLIPALIVGIILIIVLVVRSTSSTEGTEAKEEVKEELKTEEIIGQKNEPETQTKTEAMTEYNKMGKIELYQGGQETPQTLITACNIMNKNIELCQKSIRDLSVQIEIPKESKKVYLYVKVGTIDKDNKLNPLTNSESLWMYFGNKEYGGHLLRSLALVYENKDATELLFDLSTVSFVSQPYSDSKNPEKTLNVQQDIFGKAGTHAVGAFVSSGGRGKILEMNIAYK